MDELVEEARAAAPVVVVDFHAEATSEKAAMARWLDGRVTAVIGTHTHVQTNDARVPPGGTAAITDAGMTGPHDSVIGVKAELAIAAHAHRHARPVRARRGRRPARGRAGRMRCRRTGYARASRVRVPVGATERRAPASKRDEREVPARATSHEAAVEVRAPSSQ